MAASDVGDRGAVFEDLKHHLITLSTRPNHTSR
jgi:hypothetical protein